MLWTWCILLYFPDTCSVFLLHEGAVNSIIKRNQSVVSVHANSLAPISAPLTPVVSVVGAIRPARCRLLQQSTRGHRVFQLRGRLVGLALWCAHLSTSQYPSQAPAPGHEYLFWPTIVCTDMLSVPAGRFFMKWYSGCLLAHGRRLLEVATSAFRHKMKPARSSLGQVRRCRHHLTSPLLALSSVLCAPDGADVLYVLFAPALQMSVDGDHERNTFECLLNPAADTSGSDSNRSTPPGSTSEDDSNHSAASS